MTPIAWRMWSLLWLGTIGATAQDAPAPLLLLERGRASNSASWNQNERLVLRVEIAHPSERGAATDEPFVLDPEGGYARAIDIEVRDEHGQPVAWPFVRASEGSALRLTRFDRAAVSFTLDARGGGAIAPGRYVLRARLQSTSGAWRGTAHSRARHLLVESAPVPELEIAMSSGSVLYRGWPTLVRVELVVPQDAPQLDLPRTPEAWAAALQLTLHDPSGQPQGTFPVTPPSASARLGPGERCTVHFRIGAAALGELAAGTCRWNATYRAPRAAGSATESSVTGTFSFDLAEAPATLSPPLAHRRALAEIEDLLAEAAELQVARAHRATAAAERAAATQRLAGALVRAEALATALEAEHAGDAEAIWVAATVLAAQGDGQRAQTATQRALAAEVSRAPAGSEGAAPAPHYTSLLRARALLTFRAPEDANLRDELRRALAARREARPAGDQAPPSAPPSPTKLAPVAGKVSTGAARDLDAQFAADGLGQWASSATASSQYSNPDYGAARATGAPDVANHGSDARAWTPSAADRGAEQLTVQFVKPTKATEVRVRQSFHPGAITGIELHGTAGERMSVFAGSDPNAYPPNSIGWFVVQFPEAPFLVAAVVVSLDTAKVAGWNEIDAVQIVGR